MCTACVQVGHQEDFLQRRGALALEQAAQGGSGLTIPGRVQEMTGCDTYCCGLVGKVAFSQRLDLMALEVFSKLIDSVVLFCCANELLRLVDSSLGCGQ